MPRRFGRRLLPGLLLGVALLPASQAIRLVPIPALPPGVTTPALPEIPPVTPAAPAIKPLPTTVPAQSIPH